MHKRPSPKDDIVVPSGNAYKKEYLRDRWAGTEREGYRYKVGYAPSGASTCRESKTKIVKGSLRIGRMAPSPFDAEGGTADITHYYHEGHAWRAFSRSKCTSKVPLRTTDLQGFGALREEDKKAVRASLAAFREEWKAKCARARARARASAGI